MPDRREAERVYGDLADAIIAVQRAAADGPRGGLDDRIVRALSRVPTWDGPPVRALHLWHMALQMCAEVEWREAAPVLRRLVVEIGAQILERRDIPASVARTSGLIVLEALVLAAVAVDEPALANRALRRTSVRVNELFLDAGLGPGFLARRPATTHLRDAAFRAFDRVNRVLAVEAAEAGRTKLLSAVAAGHAGPAPRPPPVMGIAPSPRLAAVGEQVSQVLGRPSARRIREMVGEPHIVEVLKHLTQPWERLVATERGSASRELISDEVWGRALIEPSITWIMQNLENHQLLIYPYVAEEYFGFVLVAAEALASVIWLRSDLDVPDELNVNWVIGGLLTESIDLAFANAPEAGPFGDIRIVAWDASRESAIQQIATGMWMLELLGEDQQPEPARAPIALLPSARMLPMAAPPPDAPSPDTVCFTGDPTGDLAGPWIEAIAWRKAFGDRATVAMGAAATRAAVLSGLEHDDLVVISGHTVGVAGDEAFGIRLADGDLTHEDVLGLGGRRCASQVILSCCSAASTVGGTVRDEMLGLVTALLAVGVRQVLAPLVPVGDRGAGVIGSVLAGALHDGWDVRQALWIVGATARDFSRPVRVPSTLPAAWVEACPHSQDEMTLRGTIAPQVYLKTLLEFSVFGGAPVGQTRDL